MFKLSEIKELIKLIDQTSVNELEVENDGARLCIRKHKAELIDVNTLASNSQAITSYTNHQLANIAQTIPVSAGQAGQALQTGQGEIQDSKNNLHKIVSPMVGTYYQSSSPGAASFVKVGDMVNEKTVVCIVEAMKLMNEILAEVRGEIVEVLVENGQLIEFGQPLFLVKTE